MSISLPFWLLIIKVLLFTSGVVKMCINVNSKVLQGQKRTWILGISLVFKGFSPRSVCHFATYSSAHFLSILLGKAVGVESAFDHCPMQYITLLQVFLAPRRNPKQWLSLYFYSPCLHNPAVKAVIPALKISSSVPERKQSELLPLKPTEKPSPRFDGKRIRPAVSAFWSQVGVFPCSLGLELCSNTVIT